MPGTLDDEEIEEIIETYKDVGSMRKTAEKLDYARGTVQKYVNNWKDEQAAQDGGGDAPDGFTAEPPENSKPGDNPSAAEFRDMSEGDFIEWFFSHSGFGVAESFANNLAQQCDLRAELPDKAEMANKILSHNSQVANSHDANMIAENYWATAKRYLRANGHNPGPGGDGNTQVSGEWVESDGGSSGDSNAGQWVDTNQQQASPSPQQQRAQPQQSPRQRAQRNAQRQHGRGGRQDGRRDRRRDRRRDDEFREVISELQSTQSEILRELDSDNENTRDVGTIKDQVEEMAEIQDTLKEMTGEETQENSDVQRLQQQLEAIEKRIDQGGDGGGQPVNGEDGFAVLAQMATEDDMDPDTLGVLADAFGATDPEVKKAEYELQKEERKLESRKEMIDRVFKNASEVSGDLVGAIVGALQNNNDGGGQQQPQQQQRQQKQTHQQPRRDPTPREPQRRDGGRGQPQPPRQPREPQQQPRDNTRPAGDPNSRPGEIQVVGDGGGDGGAQNQQPRNDDPGPESSSDSGLSSVRDKFEDAVEEHSESNDEREAGSRVGEFRTAGEPEGTQAPQCEWVSEDGVECTNDAAEGDALCPEHREMWEQEV